jgi:hypothetical protein
MSNFTLNSFALNETRALHNDTDYVGVALTQNGRSVGASPIVIKYGNVNNGTHLFKPPAPAMSFSLPSFSETDHFIFTYLIINHGGGKEADVIADITQAIPLTAPAAIQLKAAVDGQNIATVGPPGLSAADDLTTFWNLAKPAFNHLDTDHCDGPVAINAFAFTGAAIAGLTLASQQQPFSINHLGINSADFCGSNSHYSVQWQVTA